MDAAELFLTCAVVLSCGNEGLVNRMLMGVPGSVGLHFHCHGWNSFGENPIYVQGNMLSGERSLYLPRYALQLLKIYLNWGETGGNFLLIMIRMS